MLSRLFFLDANSSGAIETVRQVHGTLCAPLIPYSNSSCVQTTSNWMNIRKHTMDWKRWCAHPNILFTSPNQRKILRIPILAPGSSKVSPPYILQENPLLEGEEGSGYARTFYELIGIRLPNNRIVWTLDTHRGLSLMHVRLRTYKSRETKCQCRSPIDRSGCRIQIVVIKGGQWNIPDVWALHLYVVFFGTNW